MKSINIEQLMQFAPCQEGVDWFNSQLDKSPLALLDAAKTDTEQNYLLWGLTKLLNRSNNIRLAIFSAESVLDEFEKESPTDKRPRQAIDAARAVLENDTPENRKKARAASAYYCAARAASADASAYAAAASHAASADAAAYADADAAAYASAAAYAAYAYAYASAAADAARTDSLRKSADICREYLTKDVIKAYKKL